MVLAGILVQSLSSSLVSFDLSIICRVHLLEVRLSVSFLTWISRIVSLCTSIPESVVENSLYYRFLLKRLSHHCNNLKWFLPVKVATE